MSKHTEKLDLYEIEKANDTFSTFDIDTVLNENWEKIDQNVVNKDGTVAFVATQKGVDPVEDDDLVTKKFVDDSISEIGQSYYVTYSVNSGTVDANGCANFINKIDNNTIKILGSTPVVLIHPNGKQENISADYTINSITSDGTYLIVKEYGSNPTLTTSTITESLVAPSSPADGDYWLNISARPYQPFKRVSGAWIATQFVKLGEFTRTNGIIDTPVSYAFNGFSQSLATSIGYPRTVFTTNMGISAPLYSAKLYFICVSSNNGYSVGDIIDNIMFDSAGANYESSGGIYTKNSLTFVWDNYVMLAPNKSTGVISALTIASWKIFVIAKRNF